MSWFEDDIVIVFGCMNIGEFFFFGGIDDEIIVVVVFVNYYVFVDFIFGIDEEFCFLL